MTHLGDICKINGAEIEPVDCIIGGSPCQDLSVAGKRAGLSGERSGLFMEQIRIVKEMRDEDKRSGRTDKFIRPRFMVWENVPGAFSSAEGRDFAAVLDETIRVADPNAPAVFVPGDGWSDAGAVLGRGYSLAWRVLDAQFWGVPQRRRRIALVADFGGASAPEILFERHSVSGDIEESGAPGQGTAGDAESGAGEAKCYGIDAAVMTGGNCTAQGPCYYKDISATLKASAPHGVCTAGEAEGGGREAIGIDGYNAALTGDKSATLGVNYGMTTGRNGVIAPAYAMRQREGREGGGKGPLIQTEKSGTRATGNDQVIFSAGFNGSMGDNQPAICCLNDQGGSVMDVSDDVTATLRAQQHGHQPIICIQGDIARGAHEGQNGIGVQEDICYTLNTIDRPAVAYSFDSLASNSMKSDNPHSGCREVEISKTLDTTEPNPSKNQGGICIVEPVTYSGENVTSPHNKQTPEPGVCHTLDQDSRNYVVQPPLIEMTSTENTVVKDGICPTLTARMGPGGNQVNAVMSLETYHTENHEEVASTLKVRDWKDPQCVALDRAAFNQGQNAKYDMGIDESGKAFAMTVRGPGAVSTEQSVRRLTPLECSRLQGFPDDWAHIPSLQQTEEIVEFFTKVWAEWNAMQGAKPKTRKAIIAWLQNPSSDAVEYKAYGNSIALPPWRFVLSRIYAQGARTMASLFDGIGGFPLIWQELGGQTLWASEIEPFPIAVTKYHFGEEQP